MTQPTCNKCQLFNSKEKRCSVVVMHEGEKYNLPVEGHDTCFFEQEFRAIDEESMIVERFTPEVKQLKVWVEDPKTGKKVTEGVVKIEYSES